MDSRDWEALTSMSLDSVSGAVSVSEDCVSAVVVSVPAGETRRGCDKEHGVGDP
jgi:hypothetical protein